jgi:hypothetical protein
MIFFSKAWYCETHCLVAANFLGSMLFSGSHVVSHQHLSFMDRSAQEQDGLPATQSRRAVEIFNSWQ